MKSSLFSRPLHLHSLFPHLLEPIHYIFPSHVKRPHKPGRRGQAPPALIEIASYSVEHCDLHIDLSKGRIIKVAFTPRFLEYFSEGEGRGYKHVMAAVLYVVKVKTRSRIYRRDFTCIQDGRIRVTVTTSVTV